MLISLTSTSYLFFLFTSIKQAKVICVTSSVIFIVAAKVAEVVPGLIFKKDTQRKLPTNILGHLNINGI